MLQYFVNFCSLKTCGYRISWYFSLEWMKNHNTSTFVGKGIATTSSVQSKHKYRELRHEKCGKVEVGKCACFKRAKLGCHRIRASWHHRPSGLCNFLSMPPIKMECCPLKSSLRYGICGGFIGFFYITPQLSTYPGTTLQTSSWFEAYPRGTGTFTTLLLLRVELNQRPTTQVL